MYCARNIKHHSGNCYFVDSVGKKSLLETVVYGRALVTTLRWHAPKNLYKEVTDDSLEKVLNSVVFRCCDAQSLFLWFYLGLYTKAGLFHASALPMCCQNQMCLYMLSTLGNPSM